MLTSYQLQQPALNWGEDGAPHSSLFDDVYFDKESGLEETRHVFLKHNQLSERWATLEDRSFVIAETGFGTGLNFLCAWQAFLKDASDDKQLHFISVEKYPFSRETLKTALNMWPSMKHYSEQLIDAYPEVCHGFHRIVLEQGRVQLTLWFGEAEEGFAALNANVDAWFLDGFAPSKNPEMWTDSLFKHIHRLSHKGTTCSTFTAAGIVRRGLKDVGFDVKKVKGFGQKREMVVGELTQESDPFTERMSQGQAWFNLRSDQPTKITQVLVVGSGLAGAHTAYALAEQGIKVIVWEKGESIACAASGNPQGMLYPKLTAQDSFLNRFYLSAYLHATRLYKKLGESSPFWDQCGLIQIPKDAKETERFNTLLQENVYPDCVIQPSKEKLGSLFLPLSGWVAPSQLCHALLSHHNIEVQLNTPLTQIEKMQSTTSSDAINNQWKASSHNQSALFSHVVLCTANDTNGLNLIESMPTTPVRGQVSCLSLEDAENTFLEKNESIDRLNIERVLCEFGYVSPPMNGLIHFGSTYDLKDTSTEVREEGHKRNLTILETLLSIKHDTFSTKHCQGRASFRCTVSDYTPIVGPMQSTEAYQNAYSSLTKNAKWKSNKIEAPLSQLFLNIGHGSRGLVSTPLSGSYIASMITGTPSPLEQEISYKLHPSRFVIRELKRRQKGQ